MASTEQRLQAKRSVEDRAAKLGAKRRQCESVLDRNTLKMIELLRDRRVGEVPLSQLATLLGVSRQTLYRWRELAAEIPKGQTAGQWAAARESNGRRQDQPRVRGGEQREPGKAEDILALQ